MPEPTYTLRDAGPADAEGVAALVDAAYSHYVERIGGPPGPMTLDYDEVLAADRWAREEAERCLTS